MPAEQEPQFDRKSFDIHLRLDLRSKLWSWRAAFNAEQPLQEAVIAPHQDFVEACHLVLATTSSESLRRVGDDDTVHGRCTTRDLIDHEFETITASGDPCICWSIKLRGGDSSSSSCLNRSTFPDRFGPTINGDPITGGSATHQ